MPVRVFWHDTHQQILMYEFEGHWTWKEYYTALSTGRNMMQSVNFTVCIINDMLNSNYLPPNFLLQAKTVIDSRPKNTGMVIFLSTNFFFQSMYSVMIRLYPEMDENYKIATTIEGSIATLETWLAQYASSSPASSSDTKTLPIDHESP